MSWEPDAFDEKCSDFEEVEPQPAKKDTSESDNK